MKFIKNDFFIKLSLLNGLLMGILIFFLIRYSHFIWINSFFDIFLPVTFWVVGAYVVFRSNELPKGLELAVKVSLIIGFLGIVFLYSKILMDWKNGTLLN